MSKKHINEGQLWKFTYPDVAIGKETAFVIHKIEKSSSSNDFIAHLSIYNIKHLDKKYDIGHLPIKLTLLEDILSHITLMDESSNNLPKENSNFLEGYRYWKEANGGAWNIPLIDAIKNSISHLND